MLDSVTSFSDRLLRSVEALVSRLQDTRIALRTVFGLLLIHTGLLAYSGYVHSPTLNEPAHLVAGLSHWKFGRFELYRVNPPLVRMVAALPVMAAGYNEDWSGFYDHPGARPVFGMGEDFVAANGTRSFYLFTIARWFCIPFSWIGGVVCYLWARDLYGRPAGVLACAFWSFEPNILGHASLITPDAHAAALGLAACYTFWRWLKKPTWMQATLTGVVLGLAELAKTTLILLYPLWPLMWIFYRWANRRTMKGRDWMREACMLGLRFAVSIYVLNMGYGLEGSLTPLKDFQVVSNLFAVKQLNSSLSHTAIGDNYSGSSEVNDSDRLINRFANTWLAKLPVPLPKNYVLGIDIQQRDFENIGQPSYLRGKWRDGGWWYYYLYATLVKTPASTLLLLTIVILWRATSGRMTPQDVRSEMVLLAPLLTIFLIVSSKTSFNHHLRYVLPAYPFGYIWLSQITRFMSRESHRTLNSFAQLRPIICVLAIWFILSSLWTYPHNLAYFNEWSGGLKGGPNHLLNSNIDWGQDLIYFTKWRQHHSTVHPVYLAYYGYFEPGIVGLGDTMPIEANATGLRPGWYAISVNLLYGYPWIARDGSGKNVRIPPTIVSSLRKLKPSAFAGPSIYIFHVENHRRMHLQD